MDNRHLDVISDSYKDFELAMKLAFAGCPGSCASGFAERKKSNGTNYIVLFWHKSERASDYHSFMGGRASVETATKMVWEWLNAQEEREGDDADIDGSVDNGFRLYNESWGHVDDDSYAFIAAVPVSAYYGK